MKVKRAVEHKPNHCCRPVELLFTVMIVLSDQFIKFYEFGSVKIQTFLLETLRTLLLMVFWNYLTLFV